MLTKGDHRDEKEFAQEMLINENYHPFKFKIKDKWDYSIGKINTMSADLAEEMVGMCNLPPVYSKRNRSLAI